MKVWVYCFLLKPAHKHKKWKPGNFIKGNYVLISKILIWCGIRLDRLFLLLDTGSSAVTRKAAAQQLGEVQRLHPHELPLLLKKVLVYLKSSSWDTRIAAAQAINSVISQVPQWNPDPQPVKIEGIKEETCLPVDKLKFENFNIHNVLSNRHYLTASEGKEFDNSEILMRDPKERLAFQREALNTKLGLDLAAKLGIDTGDIVSAEDLEVAPTPPPPPEDLKGSLSSREANRAKRKARQGGRQKPRDVTSESDNSPSCKKMKREIDDNVYVESTPDPAGTWPTSAQNWPFESFCELLVSKLQSPSWEVITYFKISFFIFVIQFEGKCMVHQSSCSCLLF